MTSKIDWIAARTKWESDPKLTHEALARELGVTKQAVTGQVKRKGWSRGRDYFSCQRAGYCSAFTNLNFAKISYKVSWE